MQTERAAFTYCLCAFTEDLLTHMKCRLINIKQHTILSPFSKAKHNSSPPVFGHKHVPIFTFQDSPTS